MNTMRKNQSFAYILFCLLFLLTCGVSRAQLNLAPNRIGIDGGYGITSHSTSGIHCDTCDVVYNGGTGSAPYIGIVMDWDAIDHFPFLPPEMGLTFGAQYLFSSVNMNSPGYAENVKDQNGSVVPFLRTYTLTANLPEVAADLKAYYKFGRFNVSAGFAGGFILSPTWNAKVVINSPGNITYPATNQTSMTITAPETVPDVNKTQIYITAGIGYDIPLSKSVLLRPEINGMLPFTQINASTSWRESFLTLGTALLFDLGTVHNDTVGLPFQKTNIDTVHIKEANIASDYFMMGEEITRGNTVYRTDTMYSKIVPPVAKLTIHAVEDNGDRVKITNIQLEVQYVTQAFPMLPVVFFDDHSSTFPARYNTLTTPSGFSSSSLAPDPLMLHRNVLNIVGDRLRAHPDAAITIQGFADPTTENGDCELAAARANTVKTYLTQVWGIDPSRIVSKTGKNNCVPDVITHKQAEEGYAENRRVLIESSDPTILEPIPEYRYQEPVILTPPKMEYDPTGSSTQGIRSWRLETIQNGGTMFEDTGSGAPHVVVRFISNEQVQTLRGSSPMASTLTIEDTNGLTATATDNIPVAKDTLSTEVDRLSLTLFGTAQDKLLPKDSIAIRNFMQGYNSHDTLSVLGYTDKLGDTASNRELSQRRAENVFNLIHRIAPSANLGHSVGVANSEYPPGVRSYDTPEERFLARTVQIEVRKKQGR